MSYILFYFLSFFPSEVSRWELLSVNPAQLNLSYDNVQIWQKSVFSNFIHLYVIFQCTVVTWGEGEVESQDVACAEWTNSEISASRAFYY